MPNHRYLRSVRKHAGFSGGILIAAGIVQCLTIVGIPTGISSLVTGARLMRIRNRAAELMALPAEEERQGTNAILYDFNKYLKIRGRIVLMALLSSLGVTGGLIALAWKYMPQVIKDAIMSVLQGIK